MTGTTDHTHLSTHAIYQSPLQPFSTFSSQAEAGRSMTLEDRKLYLNVGKGQGEQQVPRPAKQGIGVQDGKAREKLAENYS